MLSTDHNSLVRPSPLTVDVDDRSTFVAVGIPAEYVARWVSAGVAYGVQILCVAADQRCIDHLDEQMSTSRVAAILLWDDASAEVQEAVARAVIDDDHVPVFVVDVAQPEACLDECIREVELLQAVAHHDEPDNYDKILVDMAQPDIFVDIAVLEQELRAHLESHDDTSSRASLIRVGCEELSRSSGDKYDAIDSTLRTVIRDSAGSRERWAQMSDGSYLGVLFGRVRIMQKRRSELLTRELQGVELANDGPIKGLTPVVAYTGQSSKQSADELLQTISETFSLAQSRLDVVPYSPKPAHKSHTSDVRRDAAWSVPSWVTDAVLITITMLLGTVLPFGVLYGASQMGIELGEPLFWIVTAAILITVLSQWIEAGASRVVLRKGRTQKSEPARRPLAPGNTAIVAAYLPNEADTIGETIEKFLQAEDDLQLIVAYNTPEPVPIEDKLQALAEKDPRLVVLKVPHSTSKAQNVNAAISYATGGLIAIFDADHHPEPGVFQLARRRLEEGFVVAQGRCVVRNGATSMLARMVAVEFETIYGVSHPGRAVVHGFGIFGGSNGYWRAEALHSTRLQGAMLTEDIDASVRLSLAGGEIVSDPGLISTELAPTKLTVLWKQRLRWAQGWFQVTVRHGLHILGHPSLSRRQQFGMTFLLLWREAQPWLTHLIIPLLFFRLLQEDWSASAILTIQLMVLYIIGVAGAPVQTLFAWWNGTPRTRQRWWHYIVYTVFSAVAYQEWKNLVARVAHLREITGVNEWVVTRR